MNAEWISIDKNRSSKTPPEVRILSNDNSSTIIKINISGFDLREATLKGETYQLADLLSEVFTAKAGYPELPYISKVLAIPDQAPVSVEVIETGEVHTFKNIRLQAAKESWFEGKPMSDYKENPLVFQSDAIYPGEYAQMDKPAVFRDFRIARLSVYPLRYSPAKKELQVVSSITVKINYNNNKAVTINPRTASDKGISPAFAQLYRSFIFNYQEVLNSRYNGEETGRDLMLCIMPDEFVTSFQPYADWKRQSGTDIHITKFSDIGANSNNSQIIKDHITDAYHNWDYPPTYVLIVGDDGVFPKKTVNYDYSFASEDYFVEIDGDDFFPEMMIGRLTNQGDYRMRVMLNKFMKYEKEPYITDTNWYKKGICCSNNEFPSQVATKRFTANVMLKDGGFTSVDTLMSDGGWGGGGCSMDLDDIRNAINEGRSYLNYRGEGWSDGWSANCYHFGTSDVSGLNNGEKFTFVTSIGCGVAMFDASDGNCFGEEWVQLGSLTAPRGGVAFIGPTSNTHTTYNNKIDKGIYVGMFREGMDTPGQALLRGKLYMYNSYGDDPWVEYQYRVFCVLGDPSIHIWKDVPLEVNADYASSIPIGYNQHEFTITFASSGMPVENAQVCISGDNGVFATGKTDAEGKVFVGVTPLTPGTLTVTVRGGNVIPLQGTLTVVQAEEHVGPDGLPTVVDIDGNTDGNINPNENCSISFTLKNWGTQTANNVQASLSVVETEYVDVVTSNPISFGNLASGGSGSGSPFQIFVKPNCPVGEVISLQLHVSTSDNSWDYHYKEQVKGCKLRYKSFVVNDEGEVNRNYRMDPGETVKLFLKIVNLGDDLAPNVVGVLRTNDPYITIEDSIGTFGTLNIDAVGITDDNYFVVSIDASCPENYLANYSVKLSTWEGNYPYQTVRNFKIPVATPLPTDYTGPDDYGYYAYSNTDTLFEQAPVYEWVEINNLGNRMTVPNATSDYTKTINIPFTFKYYGLDYDELRISTDGWIAFGEGTQTAPNNHALPYNDNVSQMAAPFWDDLYNRWWEEGKIYYYNDNANHRFIIEWDHISHREDQYQPAEETFQVMLLDPAYYFTTTGDGELIFQYKIVKNNRSNTVGIENHTQDVGLQYLFNKDYDGTASVLRSETSIKFTTEAPFVVVSVDENTGNARNTNLLGQNYPNPFRSLTRIDYSIPQAGQVSLEIYNLNGELIRTLQSGQKPEGKYSVTWNGVNNSGNHVNSGIYFYRLQTNHFIETKRLLLLK
jgi:hypothetical protein